MHQIAMGDESSFRVLVERYQQLVIGTVARMIGTADAEDIAQQVFLNVWKSASRWRPQSHAKFTTWLLTITKRLVFNESRRRSRSHLIPQTLEEREVSQEHVEPSPAPDAQILEDELHCAIESAMLLLPEKERMAVILRRHQEMPYEEIALVLGVSVPSVKSLLFRARISLKQQLAPYVENGG